MGGKVTSSITRATMSAFFVCATTFAAVGADTHVTYSTVGPAFTGANSASFLHHNILTVGNQQFVAFYNENENVAVGRRTHGTDVWEVYATSFTAYNVNDGHDVISFGIDGNGYMHMSWGMHGDPLQYAKSTTPVTGSNPIAFTGLIPMTGFEDTVTYPQFYELPNGDLLFLFREITSGNGDTYWSRYDVSAGTWSTVHGGAGQTPFFKGTGWNPNYNLYHNLAAFDSNGTLHLTGTIRYNGDSPTGHGGFQTNHDMFYFRSFDEAVSWVRMDGSPYTLPISEFGENGDPNTRAEVVLTIPEGHSLINQGGMTIDNNNQPIFTTYWAPEAASGNHARQYMIGWYDGSSWHTSQVTNHRTDYDPDHDGVNNPIPESQLGAYGMWRPAILVDPDDRVILIYTDYHRGQVLTVAWSEDRVNWNFADLSTEFLSTWEPTVDTTLWQSEHKVHMLYRPMVQGDETTLKVLEWDAAAFFANPPSPPTPDPGDVLLADTFNGHLGDGATQSGLFSPRSFAAYGPGIGTTRRELILNSTATAYTSSYVVPVVNLGTPEIAEAGGYMVTLTGVDPVTTGAGNDPDWLGVSLLRPSPGTSSTPVLLNSRYGMIVSDSGSVSVFQDGATAFSSIVDPTPPSEYTIRMVVEFKDATGFGPARVSTYFGESGQALPDLALLHVAELSNVALPTQYAAIEARSEPATVDGMEIRALVPGDANLDGAVDMADVAILLLNLGGPGQRAEGDFTLDGLVDLADFAIVQRFFGLTSDD
jgi:hypothetical protein